MEVDPSLQPRGSFSVCDEVYPAFVASSISEKCTRASRGLEEKKGVRSQRFAVYRNRNIFNSDIHWVILEEFIFLERHDIFTDLKYQAKTK